MRMIMAMRVLAVIMRVLAVIMRVLAVIMRVLAVIMRVLGGCASNVLGGFASRVLFADDELCRGDAGSEDALGGHVVAGERQAAERPLQVVERQTGIDQGAEHHVARNSGEAIEVKNP
jgi:hypothetical protein